MALWLPCSGLTPLRHSRGPACGPLHPCSPHGGGVFFGGSSLAAPQTPLPSVFHSWGAAALVLEWLLGWILGAFFLLFRVRLRLFFLHAAARVVRLSIVVLCVICSSGFLSWLLCFPNGSVLLPFWGLCLGVRLCNRVVSLPHFCR